MVPTRRPHLEGDDVTQDDERQRQLDFMTAQKLAADALTLMKGNKIGVIGHALSMAVAGFCNSCGHSPDEMFTHIGKATVFYMREQTENLKDPPKAN